MAPRRLAGPLPPRPAAGPRRWPRACARSRPDSRRPRRAPRRRDARNARDPRAAPAPRTRARSPPHLNGRAAIEEQARRLREALHVRAEQDRPAGGGRLEDVVPAGGHQAPPDEDARRGLEQVRQLADGVEDDHVGFRPRPLRQRRAPDHPVPRAGRDPSRLVEPLGCRGARTSRAPPQRSRPRANARSTGSSSPRNVLAATKTGRPSRGARQASTGWDGPPSAAAAPTDGASNLRLPVTRIRDGSAPSRSNHPPHWSVWTQTRSRLRRTRRMNQAARR